MRFTNRSSPTTSRKRREPIHNPLRSLPDRDCEIVQATSVKVSILAQLPNLSRELRSTQVLVRFVLRIIVMVVFAAFGSIGFCRSLVALLWMSTILSAVIGAIRHEPPFDAILNHWDEAVAYAALCCLVSGLNQAAAL